MFTAALFQYGFIFDTVLSIPGMIILTFIALDWILDWVFLLTIGLLSKRLAYICIFLVNVISLPLWIFGFIMRVITEIVTFPIDGWPLLFGNGCFLWWGGNC